MTGDPSETLKYLLLNGEELALGWLTDYDVAYLDKLRARIEAGEDYFELLREVRGPESRVLKYFGGVVTPEASQSVVFRVADDLVEQAGIRQGRVLNNQQSALKAGTELASMAEIAKLIGKSKAAVHLALQNGRIRGWRVGHAWVIDVESALRYKASHP